MQKNIANNDLVYELYDGYETFDNHETVVIIHHYTAETSDKYT